MADDKVTPHIPHEHQVVEDIVDYLTAEFTKMQNGPLAADIRRWIRRVGREAKKSEGIHKSASGAGYQRVGHKYWYRIDKGDHYDYFYHDNQVHRVYGGEDGSEPDEVHVWHEDAGHWVHHSGVTGSPPMTRPPHPDDDPVRASPNYMIRHGALSPREVKACADYARLGYAKLNKALRRGEVPPATKVLDAAIDKFRTDRPMMVYRGIYRDENGQFPAMYDAILSHTGSEADDVPNVDAGYFSTSVSPAKALHFAMLEKPQPGMLLCLSLPMNYPALPVDKVVKPPPDEQEFLLAQGSLFDVDSVEVGDDGLVTVFATIRDR